MDIQKSKIYGLVAIVAVAIAIFAGVGLVKDDKPASQEQTNQTAQTQQIASTDVSYQGVEGKNALELLKQLHQVETKSYEGLGELVTSINGVTADYSHFWAFYVNEQQSQVGAGSYSTKATDTITWKLEEIQ